MDPNATLAEMLKLADRILRNGRQRQDKHGWSGASMGDESRLAELVTALDGWLMKGGFLPKAWAEEQSFTLKLLPEQALVFVTSVLNANGLVVTGSRKIDDDVVELTVKRPQL